MTDSQTIIILLENIDYSVNISAITLIILLVVTLFKGYTIERAKK